MAIPTSIQAGSIGHITDHVQIAHVCNAFSFFPARGASVDVAGDIQALINAGEKVITLGPGTHRISTTLTITSPSYVQIRGCGPGVTIIAPDAGVDAFTISAASTIAPLFALEDLSIVGGRRGLNILDSSFQLLRPRFTRLVFTNQTDAGIYSAIGIYNGLFELLSFEGSPYGMYVAPVRGFHANKILNCAFRTTTICGLYLARTVEGGGVISLSVDSCLFESNGRLAIRAGGTHSVMIEGGWFENNGTDVTGGPYPDIDAMTENAVDNYNLMLDHAYIATPGPNNLCTLRHDENGGGLIITPDLVGGSAQIASVTHSGQESSGLQDRAVLRASNGAYYRVYVDTDGTLKTAAVT